MTRGSWRPTLRGLVDPRGWLWLVVVAAVGAAWVGWPKGASRAVLVVHLVDISRSIGPDPNTWLARWEGEARRFSGDRTAVVAVGRGAWLIGTTDTSDLGAVLVGWNSARKGWSPSDREGFRLPTGLELAQTLVREGEQLQIVVWTDGRWPQAHWLALEGSGIHWVAPGPLGPVPDEVWLGVSGAPVPVPAGEAVEAWVDLACEGATDHRCDLVVEAVLPSGVEELARSRWVLKPGDRVTHASRVSVPPEARSIRWRVVDLDERGGWPGNDMVQLPVGADTLTVGVLGDPLRWPRVPGVRWESWPRDGVVSPEVIALENEPATPEFVAEMGGRITQMVTADGQGLVILGGPTAFRGGGYANTFLEGLSPLSSRPSTGRDVHVMLDHSGSMSNGRLERAVDAVLLLAEGLSPDDRIQVHPFAAEPSAPFPDAPAPGVRPALEAALRPLRPQGGTRLGPGIQGVLDRMKSVAANPSRQAVLVVLSDLDDPGFDAVSWRAPLGATFAGRMVWVVLDPSSEAMDRASAVGGEVRPVKDFTPRVLLDAVEGDAYRHEVRRVEWVQGSPGGPTGAVSAWNRVSLAPGGELWCRTDAGEPMVATASRGAGRVAAVAARLEQPLVESILPGLLGHVRRTVPQGFVRPRPVDPADPAGREEREWELPASVVGPLWVETEPGEAPLREVAPGRWVGKADVPVLGRWRVKGPSGETVAWVRAEGLSDPEWEWGPSRPESASEGRAPSPGGGPNPWLPALVGAVALGSLACRNVLRWPRGTRRGPLRR